MNPSLVVLCLLHLQLSKISTLIFSGEIIENTTFFYRRFPTFPSKSVTLEYNISYRKYLLAYFPVLFIYTTENHTDVHTKCISSGYGQLRNEDFWIPLNPRLIPYRQKTKCVERYEEIHCSGKITITDYIPRTFAFSVGFLCRNRTVPSIQGLGFKFLIANQSNTTDCTKRYDMFAGICRHNYDYTTSGNLVGVDFDVLKRFSKQSTILDSILDETLVPCYQNIYDLLCSVFIPKCDPFNNRVVHVCREMCHDFLNACYDHVFYMFRNTKKKWLQKNLDKLAEEENDIKNFLNFIVNCNYLPTKLGPVPCFYKPVFCGAPPNVTNAWATNGPYNATSTIEYSCLDETFHVEGNKTIEYLYSGNWTKPPRCLKRKKSVSPLFIVLPLLLGSMFIYFMGLLVKRFKVRAQQILLTRTKDYDAFICYAYEGNDLQFAEETLRTQLEEKHQFKLCIHRRDFLAAWDIMWNINNAIKNSNSAIIIMSQDYINSLWCREEFEQCYLEHMKDPAFKLFVIMMQPVEDLEDISIYMERFFSQKTYLLEDDPAIFKKIASYLSWVKEPKENPVKTNDRDHIVNNDDSDSDSEAEKDGLV